MDILGILNAIAFWAPIWRKPDMVAECVEGTGIVGAGVIIEQSF